MKIPIKYGLLIALGVISSPYLSGIFIRIYP